MDTLKGFHQPFLGDGTSRATLGAGPRLVVRDPKARRSICDIVDKGINA